MLSAVPRNERTGIFRAGLQSSALPLGDVVDDPLSKSKAAGATVVRPEATAFREVDVSGKLLHTADILYPFVEADRIINVPVVKQHGLSRATMAMKNWYGVLGGQRVKLHQNIHLSIVDLAAMIKPTLTIMDATRILLANGPTGGSLADVKRMDTVAVSTDEVALDAFGAGLLGLATLRNFGQGKFIRANAAIGIILNIAEHL